MLNRRSETGMEPTLEVALGNFPMKVKHQKQYIVLEKTGIVMEIRNPSLLFVHLTRLKV